MGATPETQSTYSLVLLWFGASVSIAEIITGALLAPLGFEQGMLAILSGHALGFLLLALAGFIGATSGLSASASFRISFGAYGSYGFSLLNICQLLGWTAVMIVSGAKAFDGITASLAGYQNETLWCALIGGLILIWTLLGLRQLFKINVVIITALFLSFLVLGYTVLTATRPVAPSTDSISFGAAVELNVAMIVSWLPLISDYTRTAKHPVRGTLCSVLSYCSGSILMFTIGLGAARNAGTADIGIILASSGLGVLPLFIIAFSSVVTTFFDAHSAGVNAVNINSGINPKIVSILICCAGTFLAIVTPMSQYINFLYLIGSVFSPLFSILFVDFYIFKKRTVTEGMNSGNVLFWLGGCLLYHMVMEYHWVAGNTFPVMAAIGCAYFIFVRLQRRVRNKPSGPCTRKRTAT